MFGERLPPKFAMTAECDVNPLLPKLSEVLVAQIMSFLPFADTLQSLLLARAARLALSHRTAWDPLIIGRQECSNLVRYMTKWNARQCIPAGMYQVTELRADVGNVDFRGYPHMRYLHPLCTFQSLCEVLQRHFSELATLELSNIEDCNIDFDNPRRGCGFLKIRSGLLADFTSALLEVTELQPKGKDSCTQALYRLKAERHGKLPPVEDPEALFLKEHRACRESDGDYCVGHARQRKYSRDSVQRHYAEVIAKNRVHMRVCQAISSNMAARRGDAGAQW
jgi:hypothetical protein